MLSAYKQILSLIMVLVIATSPAMAGMVAIDYQDEASIKCDMSQMMVDMNEDDSCPMQMGSHSPDRVHCDNNCQFNSILTDHVLELIGRYIQVKYQVENDAVLASHPEQIVRPPKT